MKTLRVSRGFTLLELLLVSAMVVFVGMAVYGALSSGIAVYNWLERSKPANEAVFLFERVSGDLRNLCPLPEQGFLGMPNRMIFHIHDAQHLIRPDGLSQGRVMPIERVEYLIEPSGTRVVRNSYEYGSHQAYSSVTALSGVGPVQFRYVADDERTFSSGNFLDNISEVPVAVEVTVGSGSDKFRRIVRVPISGL